MTPRQEFDPPWGVDTPPGGSRERHLTPLGGVKTRSEGIFLTPRRGVMPTGGSMIASLPRDLFTYRSCRRTPTEDDSVVASYDNYRSLKLRSEKKDVCIYGFLEYHVLRPGGSLRLKRRIYDVRIRFRSRRLRLKCAYTTFLDAPQGSQKIHTHILYTSFFLSP